MVFHNHHLQLFGYLGAGNFRHAPIPVSAHRTGRIHACFAAQTQHIPHKAVAAVTDRLRADCAQPLSLEALSREAGYTPQYLSALFRKDTGMSIQEFLQRLRIQEACRLLEQTQLSLCDIAQAVGYNDPKHFSRLFRRYKGLSPKELRKTRP